MIKESNPQNHKQRSCVAPFIAQVERTLSDGGSMKDAFNTRFWYKKYIEDRIEKHGGMRTAVKPIHAFAMGSIFLGGVVAWVGLRHHGVPLPDPSLFLGAVPVASLSDSECSFNANKINAQAQVTQNLRNTENRRVRDGGYTVDTEASALASPRQRVQAAPHRVGTQAIEGRIIGPSLQSGNGRGFQRSTPDDSANDGHRYMELIKEKERVEKAYFKKGTIDYGDYLDQIEEINLALQRMN